jgi:hypothetical protein
MHLEWSAVTMASHLCLVFAIACAFVNAVTVAKNWLGPASAGAFARLEGPIFAIAATLMVERLYYVAARLLVKTELNLWSAHPAPELLSFSATVAVFWLAVAIRYLDETSGRIRRSVITQTLGVCALFVSVAWGLW